MRIFKKVMKWAGLTLALLMVLGGAFIAHSWFFKPVNINIFFARAFMQVALESPEMLSSIRVLEQFGIKGHNAKLDDESMAAGDRLFEHMKESRQVLLSYADDDLAETQAQTLQIEYAQAEQALTRRLTAEPPLRGDPVAHRNGKIG